jgi:hypothetical protein
MGIGYGVTAFSFLGSSPISGALLTSEYKWSRAIVFNGVSHFRCGNRNCRPCLLIDSQGLPCGWVSHPLDLARAIGTRKKNVEGLNKSQQCPLLDGNLTLYVRRIALMQWRAAIIRRSVIESNLFPYLNCFSR